MRKLLKKDRDSKLSPAPSSSNPYAQQGPDPYGAPKPSPPPTRTTSSFSQPPAYSPGPASTASRDKTPVPPGGYGGPRFGGVAGQNGYGSQAGYGTQTPYGGTAETLAPPVSRYGPGGYGGLGRSNSQDTVSTEAGRNALFGDAPSRIQQQHAQMDGQLPPESDPGGGYAASNGYSAQAGATSQGYGQYESKVLSPEEEEEEDVKASKDQIRFLKQSDVSSTRNALRILAQSEDTGRETLARLGAQGDRVHNVEKNLDLASNQNRLADEKARELKKLNGSMFAMHASNPFTKTRRAGERDQAVMDKHWDERDRRDATRREAYKSTARQAETAKGMRDAAAARGEGSKSLAERSKYQFEADSEDEEMENEIDSNLDQLASGAARLNQLGRAIGREVDEQNNHIDRIIGKTDRVDDQIAMNRARLDRIR